MSDANPGDIAIIGMAGRFPKAPNIDVFWNNLCAGTEGISFFTDAELAAEGLACPDDPRYVKARGMLENASLFDAAFFGIKPQEAEGMDPQHRIFLECAWEALEDAGYDSERYEGAIGMYAGMSMNTYLPMNIASHPELVRMVGDFQLMLGNDKDFLPTRTSYKLNLKGPSLNIQTACSTSLVTICVACQQLLNYQCDIALAGAVSLLFPQKQGYLFQEGGIGSPDGHCRAFDAQAAGTVRGEGVGLVVLKRLAEALADGDHIYALIKGFALNNDGSLKTGYTAPSVEGQAQVIAMAQAMADINPVTIRYVEAHGTGTPLGDPIEIAGLTRAFRTGTEAKNYCAIGSVKSAIGHLDVAAGVAGFIKTALALRHRQLPPSLHFTTPNPKIDFANSPFYVNQVLTEWARTEHPRRAGVSSFGIGGTNAHVVLEEAPDLAPTSEARPTQLLLVSAKTESALNQAAANLGGHLELHPELNLADVAFTLQVGRRAFPHRRMLVCREAGEAVKLLATPDARRLATRVTESINPPIVFMFPGQGAQQVNMSHELYRTEPVFRAEMDRCSELLKPHLGLDLRSVLYPAAEHSSQAQLQLNQTALTQPALFVVEYALATLWMSWGVKPESMIGHSLGEYVAACLAGVFSLETGLKLIATRGRLMQEMPPGAMLAVRLPEGALVALLPPELSIAAVNSVSSCVVSGPQAAIKVLQSQLEARQAPCAPLPVSHAFHSAMMEPMLKAFAEIVQQANLQAPRIPFLSNVTGTWITSAEATDPGYWVRHLRHTVRFAAGLGELFKLPERLVLEVGPGHTLTSLAKQHPARPPQALLLASFATSKETPSEAEALLHSLGQLWLAGVQVNWSGFYTHERRRRVRLPSYPFERISYWVEPARSLGAVRAMPADRQPASLPAAQENPSTPPKTDGTTSRHGSTVAALRKLIGELSGASLAGTDGATTFTELGFESLFLTQLSLAVERQFGVPVAFRKLLEELASLNALADHLDQAMPGNAGQSHHNPAATEVTAPIVRERTVDQLLPLTEAQRELWFASQLSDAASCAYSECRLLHFHGIVRVGAMQTALQQLVNRHEALRASFSATGERQRIRPELTFAMSTVDWSTSGPSELAQKLDAWQRAEARQPFDLGNGPLLRAHLIQLGGGKATLGLTAHHIICDGHSMGILLHELATLYAAACGEIRPPLTAPLQLSDYAQLHRGDDPRTAVAEQYWVNQFADGAPVLELPADHPRPSAWTFNGGHERCTLPAAVLTELKRIGSRQGGTLFATLLSAWLVLLRRLTGQAEIVVGIPIADRAMTGGHTLVAHALNFLPFRASVDPESTFTTHLAAVQKRFLDAHEHQHCSFGTLLQKLNLKRDSGRMPLVSTTFNVERLGNGLDFVGLEVALELNRHSLTDFELGFNATEINGTLQIDCRYNADLFEAQTVNRWLGHFQTLLAGLLAGPEQTLSRLPLLSPEEKRLILAEWNDTRRTYPDEHCLHQLFTAQVARTPEAIALTDGHRRFSYRELDCRADRLAVRLRLLGVGPEVLVAVCTERSAEMVMALLAILKAGGAYVPMDPRYPRDRIAFMLEDTRAPVLISQSSLLHELPAHQASVIRLDEFDWEHADATVGSLNRSQPSDLAYVIYTSGSTGKPKGVAIAHRSAANLIHWARETFPAQDLAGVLFSTSICFDLSVFEMFTPLATGGMIILAENALALPELPAQHAITLINTVPSAIAELVRLNAIPASVRTVCLAGEPLKAALVDRLHALGTLGKVYDLYGPSETTTYSTCALRQPGAPPTIGRPLANTQVYILDAAGQPQPIGITGEVYIGGAGLARGYLNRPELTAEKFIPHPFIDQAQARLYRTGDLARWYPDGNIAFFGRTDHQVKIRGHRIELGEIETLLARQPGVRECLVLAREDVPGGQRLVAYLVPAPGQAAPGVAGLRQALGQTLPDYMIPSAFIILAALPLTPNGKVDRRALPVPEGPLAVAAPFIAPSTATEEILAQIWREVLGAKQVGVNDSFFELGGHSLLAIQIISRVRDAFQIELPMRRFFEHPTIAGLALTVEEILLLEINGLSDEEARRLSAVLIDQ